MESRLNTIPDAINASPDKNFTQISNTIFDDNSLSLKAKGILCTLLSNKKGHWTSYLQVLQTKSTDGIDSLRSGLRELEDHGYLLRISYVDKKTKAKQGSFWSYTDEPNNHDIEKQLELLDNKGMEIWGGSRKSMRSENPNKGNPYMGEPIIGKPIKAAPTLIIPNSNNTKNNNTKLNNTKEKDINGKRGLFKKELDSSSSLPIKSRTRSTPKETPPYKAIQELWNETVNGSEIPRIVKLTDQRKKHINARFKDAPTLDDWKSLFKSIIETPFLCGDNNINWKASFDWLIESDTHFTKVLEGNYKSSKKKQSDTGNTNWGVSYPKSDEEREEMFAKLEARTIHYNSDTGKCQ